MISKIFILHHTHVDFGYTGDREKVCNDLVRMVEQSTALVERMRERPEPERFRWIHEVSWQVLEYIRRGGKSREKLFEHIRSGLSELTALYVNPTDLFDYDTFRVSTDYAVDLARNNNLPLDTAMFSDSPGMAWSIVDILAERGVKYLSASPNFIMSMPLDVERPFYWEGPKGGRLLVWFTDWRNSWYAEGFVLRLHEDPAGAAKMLLEYVAKLHGEGYRWSGLAIHVAMDNEPPLPQLCDFVEHFNGAQPDVSAALATNHDFFSYMEKTHGPDFSIHRGAWPDWWANGNASAAHEVACSRRAKAALRRASAMTSAFGVPLDGGRYQRALESLLIFDEHTWGASTSVTAPWSHRSRKQWLEKRLLAADALMHAYDLEQATVEAVTGDGALAIVNPFDSEYVGPVEIPADERQALRDIETGDVYAAQPAPSEPGRMVCVPQLPPLKSRAFEYAERGEVDGRKKHFDNEHFTIAFDPDTGAVAQVMDKTTDGAICTDAEFGFAELIHERVRGGDRDSIYDISRGSTNPEAKRPRPEFIRTAGHADKSPPVLASGPVFDSLLTEGSLPGVRFKREIRLYHAIHRIDVFLTLNKQVVTTYESLYLAFPFECTEPEVFIEHAGAVYRAGAEQLPGSATDWHSVGEYLALSNNERTIVLVPHDVPLVQLADINTGKWQKSLDLRNGRVYSWLMNNMWFTNFPAWQEGEVKLAWSLTARNGEFDEAAASLFSKTCRTGVSVRADRGNTHIVW